MTLYDYLFSGNGWKVRRTLRLLGRPFDWVEVDILSGETRSEAFRALNPVGEIPVLQLADGACLAESHAILLFLTEGTPWLPEDPVARARVVRWLCFEQTHVDGVISRARFRRAYPELIPTSEADFARWAAQGERALGVLDQHLAGRAWLEAGRPTVADVAVAAYVQVADEGGFDLASRAHVRRWLDQVAALPGHLPIDARPAGARRWSERVHGASARLGGP
ncbi:MAG: glutathione S-transferase family protein [Alphaproteobacteria bacterium]|nr:glutathione S-transferase family protein [Alphaproteobacteria bacterium]